MRQQQRAAGWDAHRVSHAAKDQAGAHASKACSPAKGTGGYSPLPQLPLHLLLLLADLHVDLSMSAYLNPTVGLTMVPAIPC